MYPGDRAMLIHDQSMVRMFLPTVSPLLQVPAL